MIENISKLYDVGARFADSIMTPLKVAHAQMGPVYDGADSVKQTMCDGYGSQEMVDFAIEDAKGALQYYETEGLTHGQAYKYAVEELNELEACSGSIQSYVQRAGEKITEGAQKIGDTASDIVSNNGYQITERVTDASSSDPTGIIAGVVGVIGIGIGGIIIYSKKNQKPSQKHYSTSKTSSAV